MINYYRVWTPRGRAKVIAGNEIQNKKKIDYRLWNWGARVFSGPKTIGEEQTSTCYQSAGTKYRKTISSQILM